MGGFASRLQAREDEPRLLPALLDYRAAHTPDRIWAKFPASSTSYEDGFRAATYAQMRNAVDRVAWLLREQIGQSTTFETLAYMGPGDLRYHIVLLAAVKAGYKPFFPSPRNSVAAQKHLLERLETRVLVTTDPEPVSVSSIRREYPIEIIRIPSLDELLWSQNVPPYPYNKTFEEARHEPLFVLHTSGSTGIPKPLIYSHEFSWRIYKANSLPSSLDKHLLQGEWFSFLPAFHMAGIGLGFVLAVYSGNIPVWPLPNQPPSADSFIEAIKYGTFTWAYLLPVILDGLSKDPEGLELVASKLKFLIYTGGALPESIGERVSSRISTFNAIGSSECGPLPQFRLPDTDLSSVETWRYLYIHPTVGPQFRHHMDDLHELVFQSSDNRPEVQPVFDMFPDLQKYETRDLFSPHPKISNFWRHRGRRDDIIVFLNGEKTNPISFEQHVSQHPAVRSSLVIGSQRVEACLLVEAASTEGLDEKEKSELVGAIWPTVEEANALCPAHARVTKSKILILDAERPMLRAGKGTVQRAGTVQLYQDEIDALYAETDAESGDDTLSRAFTSFEDAIAALHSLVRGVTSWSKFEGDADFFALGMDSLQVLRLSRAIQSALGVSVPQGVIYKNPSLELLAKQLCTYDAANGEADRTAMMMRMLQSYERQVDELASNTPDAGQPMPCAPVIVLTGSTGTLGTFVLDELLSNPDVSHIYCLNRSQDSEFAQTTGNKARKLPYDFPGEKVTFLTVDLTQSSLGLDPDTYTTLLNTATQIIHNAWPVNFNQPLQYFAPSLDGVYHIITLAHLGKHRPSLLFISSISAVSSYSLSKSHSQGLPTPPTSPNTSTPSIPEEIHLDPSCAAQMGYGESKYLAERILHYASTKLRIVTGIARIGQICGTASDPRGWSRTEWFPSLVLGSKTLRALPESLGENSLDGEIDWVPVDLLAPVMVELANSLCEGGNSGGGARVFHCVNPNRVRWADLVHAIVEELSITTTIKNGGLEESAGVATVSLAEWVKRLQDSIAGDGGGDGADISSNPAAKLVGFYEQILAEGEEGAMRLSTFRTEELSKGLRGMPAVRPEWVRGWMREWLHADEC
ncbi:putative NRPS-like enzyme [Aspergillus insuetus]